MQHDSVRGVIPKSPLARWSLGAVLAAVSAFGSKALDPAYNLYLAERRYRQASLLLGIFIIYVFSVSPVLYAQEINENDITAENKKYAVLYYYMQVYNDENYVNRFVEKLSETKSQDRLKLIKIDRTIENDNITYTFSGECIFQSNEAGYIISRIKLTDTFTGDPAIDDLIASLRDGRFFGDNLEIIDELVEEGMDENGKFKIHTKWELGRADYLLRIFKNTLYSVKNKLLNYKYLDKMPW
ncbi:MAG: hypothetical protein LBQ14_05555 [Treponema sp.]|jgi:hypothetical protein|nr:hypothetical protein [Treponema sp.]